MNDVFFTSDLHLGHRQPFIYESRGFASIEEHDAAIIQNINDMVRPSDTLYILGDLMLNDDENGIRLLNQIKCQDIYVVFGNHDTTNRILKYMEVPASKLKSLGYGGRAKFGKKSFFLSHYPTLTMNFEDGKRMWERTYNLCGHTHSKNILDPNTNSIHVELDAWDNRPVPLDEIQTVIRVMNGLPLEI